MDKRFDILRSLYISIRKWGVMAFIIRHKRLFAALYVILTVVWFLAGFFLPFNDSEHTEYVINLYTETFGVLLGIGATVFIIDQIYERRDWEREQEMARREKERQTQELKERLVWEAGSRSNNIAISAIEQLRLKGWLTGDDGLLKRVDLTDANLQGANLSDANLEGMNLSGSNLTGADLHGANLTRATLNSTNLQEATLLGANLQEAEFINVNLQKAVLLAANLQGATFHRGKFQSADLRQAGLQNAQLTLVNLCDAVLSGANLQWTTWAAIVSQGAGFLCANLQDATLREVNLERADLRGAYLRGLKLTQVKLQEATLPDGTSFTSDKDMCRFIDEDEPEYGATLEKIESIRSKASLPGKYLIKE